MPRAGVVWLVLGFLALGPGGGLAAQVSPGPLARAHRELEGALKCTSCHARGKAAMDGRCAGCHRDVAWLAERSRGLHGSAAVRGQPCASCHPDHAGAGFELVRWPDGSRERFDHRRAGWPLQQSHQGVECDACHDAANRRPPVAALAPNGRARWTGLEPGCGSCHEDTHRGALGAECSACHDAGKWAVTPGFAHDTTAYPLTGRHTAVACDQCHLDPRLVRRRDAAGRPVPVYRPVPHQSCASCHQDPHQGRFGASCASCHSTQGFDRIDGRGFDHGRTSFPLRGRHQATPCGGCHRDLATEAGRRPAAATCGACHADAHDGFATLQGRPADCAACHDERGFTPSTYPMARHQASRYPLEGKHQAVPCGSCHRRDRSPVGVARWGTSRVLIRPPFAACTGCHAEQHGTALANRAGGGECSACHGVEGWAPSTFGRAEHAALALPLEGRHAEIDCRACHGADRPGLPPPAAQRELGKARFAFTGVGAECVACHVDPHQGRFAAGGARPAGQGCVTCHDARAFAPAAVDVAVHERFQFALRGAHRATPCAACHVDRPSPTARRPRGTLLLAAGRVASLTFEAPTACAECHRSVHGPQFDGRKDGGRCDACHADDAFAPASRFDHDRDAAFALRGAHQQVACGACHRSDPVAGGAARVVYRPVPRRCEDCHTRAPATRRAPASDLF